MAIDKSDSLIESGHIYGTLPVIITSLSLI